MVPAISSPTATRGILFKFKSDHDTPLCPNSPMASHLYRSKSQKVLIGPHTIYTPPTQPHPECSPPSPKALPLTHFAPVILASAIYSLNLVNKDLRAWSVLGTILSTRNTRVKIQLNTCPCYIVISLFTCWSLLWQVLFLFSCYLPEYLCANTAWHGC